MFRFKRSSFCYPLISCKCNDALLPFFSVRSHQQFSPHEGSLDLSMFKGCRCRGHQNTSILVLCSVTHAYTSHFSGIFWPLDGHIINQYPSISILPMMPLCLNSARVPFRQESPPTAQASASSFLASTLGFFRALP